MQIRAVLLAAVLAIAPLVARAADLVVWWEEGYNPEEDAATREIIAAFEHKTGKRVELVQPSQDDVPGEDLGRARGGPSAGFPVRHADGLLLHSVGL